MDERRERALKRVEKYIIQRKYDQAIAILKPLVSQDSRNITLLNMMANTCDLAGKKFLALKYFNESADVYNESSFYSRAIAVLKKVAKIDPGDPEPFEKIAHIYLTQSNFNEASSYFREAANLLRISEKPDRAVNLFYKALELDSANQRLRMELIETYKELGQKNEAVEHYLIFVGDFIKRADLQGAKTILENILKLDPNHITALTKLAEISSGLGDKDQTLALYQRIFSLERNNPETLFSFANEYFKRFRDAENAANMLKKAHRLDPENLRILITLKAIVPNDLEVRQALKVYYLEQGDRRKAIMEIMSMADIFAMAKNDKMATKLREKATVMLKELDLAEPQETPPLRQAEQVVSLDTVANEAEAGSGVQPMHKKADAPIPQEVAAVDSVLPGKKAEGGMPESYTIITEKELGSPKKLETPPVREQVEQIVELVSEELVAVEPEQIYEPEMVVETGKTENIANVVEKTEPAHYENQAPEFPVTKPEAEKEVSPLQTEPQQIRYQEPKEQIEAPPSSHMTHGERDHAPEAFDAVVPLPHDQSEDESVFIDDIDIDPDTLAITVKTTKITDEAAGKAIKPKTTSDDETRFSPEAVEYAKDAISDVSAVKAKLPQDEIPPDEPVAELRREDLVALQSSSPDMKAEPDFSITGVFDKINLPKDITEEEADTVINFSDNTANLSIQMNTLLNSMVGNEDEGLMDEDEETSFNLGASYMEMRLYDDAVEELRPLLSSPRYRLKAGQLMGVAYTHNKDTESALQCYLTILPHIPDESETKDETIFTIGDLYLAVDDYENSYKYFMSLHKRNPNFPGLTQKIESFPRLKE